MRPFEYKDILSIKETGIQFKLALKIFYDERKKLEGEVYLPYIPYVYGIPYNFLKISRSKIGDPRRRGSFVKIPRSVLFFQPFSHILRRTTPPHTYLSPKRSAGEE